MKTIQISDNRGESLTVQEHAGLYFSKNVEAQTLMNLTTFQARSDDILLVTYPKSGTHWLHAIVKMLAQNLMSLSKEQMLHLEYAPTQFIDSAPSPRILCTHLPFSMIPVDFLRKKAKIVVCVRNPRDVAVSYFNFCANTTVIDYKGDFDGFLNLFMKGSLPYGSWFDHVPVWMKAAQSESDKHSIHVLLYEDLQRDFMQTIEALSKFLEIDTTLEFLEELQRQTTFANMKNCMPDFYRALSKSGHSIIYRKGLVGDWSNYFSPEQLAQLNSEMEIRGLQSDKYLRSSLV